MDEHSTGFMSGVITVALAIVGVATLAVVLSRNSNTAAIIQDSASGISNALEAAEAPVTGAAERPNLTYSSGSSLSDWENESSFY